MRRALVLAGLATLALPWSSLAQQTSIRPGQKLSVKEMQTLIDELFACEQPYHAPNKKFTFLTFNFDELEKRFSKPGS